MLPRAHASVACFRAQSASDHGCEMESRCRQACRAKEEWSHASSNSCLEHGACANDHGQENRTSTQTAASLSTSSCFLPETGNPRSRHIAFSSSTFFASNSALLSDGTTFSAAALRSFSAAAFVTTSIKGSSSSSSAFGSGFSSSSFLAAASPRPAIKASNALVLSSSTASCFGTSSEKPVLCRFRGCSAAAAAATISAAAAVPGTTPRKTSGPSRRSSSWNSSKSSIAVAPGQSFNASSLALSLPISSNAAQDESAEILPWMARSFSQPVKLSRRLRSSLKSLATSGVGTLLARLSASCSMVGFKSRRDAQTRRASNGGCSSKISSLRAKMTAASFQRRRARLSSGSDAMSLCSRTTRPGRLSMRAFLCFSSNRSITIWNTSSRRTSDLIMIQASSEERTLAASSYVVVTSSGRPKRSSMRRSKALAAFLSFSRASICFFRRWKPMSSAKHCFRTFSLNSNAKASSRVTSATPCQVQPSSTPFSRIKSQKIRRFSAIVCGSGRSSTPELSPRNFRNSGGILQQLTFVSLLW
mmetsp:Transcript_67449/g.174720  ORF Transcript_67449/g.174720 Transcript_67449/m.174720 type:complete len:532 (+) Transcript_67449:57-1652(+)